MPDYTVLIRVSVTDAESPKMAARSAQCFLFDELADQIAVVQNDAGVVIGTFPFSELDWEFEDDADS